MTSSGRRCRACWSPHLLDWYRALKRWLSRYTRQQSGGGMRCLWGLHTMRSMLCSRPSMSTHSPWPGHNWLDQESCVCRCGVLFCQEGFVSYSRYGSLVGRQQSLPGVDLCILVAGVLGDERHMIFECPGLQDLRAQWSHLFQGPETMQAFIWQGALFVNMCLHKVAPPGGPASDQHGVAGRDVI